MRPSRFLFNLRRIPLDNPRKVRISGARRAYRSCPVWPLDVTPSLGTLPILDPMACPFNRLGMANPSSRLHSSSSSRRYHKLFNHKRPGRIHLLEEFLHRIHHKRLRLRKLVRSGQWCHKRRAARIPSDRVHSSINRPDKDGSRLSRGRWVGWSRCRRSKYSHGQDRRPRKHIGGKKREHERHRLCG